MDFQEIVALENDPGRLEELHARDPEGFALALPQALGTRPDALLLRAWAERLKARPAGPVKSALNLRELLPLTLLAVLVGALLVWSLPDVERLAYGSTTGMNMFSLLSLLPTAAVCGLLLYWRSWPRQRLWLPVGVLSLLLLAKALVLYGTDQMIGQLADSHLSMLTFFAVGLSFIAEDWRSLEGWKKYVRFYGDVMAYSLLYACGLGFLAALGFCLFMVLEVPARSYVNAIIMGASMVALVSYWLAFRLGHRALLSKAAMVLTPPAALFLVLYLPARLLLPKAYVAAMAPPVLGPALYLAAALLALWLAVYCVIGLARKGNRFVEYSLVVMVGLAVATSIPMLDQVIGQVLRQPFAYWSLAVIGGTLVLFGHLAAIAVALVFKLLGRFGMDRVEAVTVHWMPVYIVWTLFMGWAAPWLF